MWYLSPLNGMETWDGTIHKLKAVGTDGVVTRVGGGADFIRVTILLG